MENSKKRLIMPTKLLLNNKELANFLITLIDIKKNIDLDIPMPDTDEIITLIRAGIFKRGLENIDIDTKKKYYAKISKSVRKDLSNWVDQVKLDIEIIRESKWNHIHKNIDYILDKLGENKILEKYKQSNVSGFVKGCGLYIDTNGILIRRHRFVSYNDDCLIRNTVGNEELLITKIDKRFPFWFIDSGYTNFLETNKQWHRLVRNHLHYGKYFDAPTDRLSNFKSFPKPWRQGGDIIYVIEPGPFAANIFHVDLKSWKYDVESELRKYTDKKIKFREKAPKRERSNLYQELANDDYYCIISINSNAATESIWQGVPAITLDKHITNPITVNKLSDIDNLYRGRIADWLCMLSYSQFTYEELLDGKAFRILTNYHG